MWQSLFANACILITLLFIASQLLYKNGTARYSGWKLKIYIGILGGLASIVLFYFSISIAPNVKMDFRDFGIIMASIFGGWLPSLITGVIVSVFRLIYNGFDWTSVMLVIGILVACLGCSLLSIIRIQIKWMYSMMLIYCLIIRSLVFYLILRGDAKVGIIILNIWLSTIFMSFGVLYFTRYLITSYRLLHVLQIESKEDYLTGLSNKRFFNREFHSILVNRKERSGNVSLLILDIDDFKEVNDTYGHGAGDSVLRELGKVLKETLERSCIISRVGGEEFAVILKDKTREETLETAEIIRKSVINHTFTIKNGKKLKISVSIGGAVYPETLKDIGKLSEEADKNLYIAKKSGKNKVYI